jgi:polysaccharide export outer membrane protein
VAELQQELLARLTPFISEPTISVAVVRLNSYRIYVLGKVNRPGEFLVGHETDVLQALSLAGGTTPFAAENRIKIIRRVRDVAYVYEFRYGDAKDGQNLEQNIVLRRGDVVLVP